MSGLETGAAVLGLIVSTIDIIHKSIEIYDAVKDKSGIPKKLKKVSDKLSSVEKLLKGAQAQYNEGKLNKIDKQTWDNAKQEIRQCKELCQELHQLLLSAYPDAGSGRVGRVWKGTQTVFSNKGKSAEALLKEIWEHLDMLAKQQIINNAALLEEIKTLVQELCPDTTTKGTQDVHGDVKGDMIHTINGDKNVNAGAGQMFTGSGGTYQFVNNENKYPLKHLPFASNAPFNAYHRQRDSNCLPGTRQYALEEIYKWIEGDAKSCVFWLNGWPGTGKSAIARTVARHYHTDGHLAASFFFSRGGGECSHAGLFVTSIARQLADNETLGLQQVIRCSLEEHGQIAKQTLQDQWTQLVVQPLARYKRSDTRTFVVVVDALDECEEEGSIGILLRLLPQVGSCNNIRVRILVTSRPETAIRHGFDQMKIDKHRNFVLHRIPTEMSNKDIQVYLQHHFSMIATQRQLDDLWPGEEILMTMVQYAQGLFIWAATTCTFIRDGGRFAVKRLQTLLDRSANTVSEPEKHLDAIYTTVLCASILEAYSEEERREACEYLRLVLGSIIVLFSALSVEALSKLLNLRNEAISETIADLHSIIDIPTELNHPLRLHHDSFRDFLLNEDRCKEREMVVNEQQAHLRLAKGCLKVMSSLLSENICVQSMPGVLLSDVTFSHVQQCLPGELQYACLYWAQHSMRGAWPLLDGGDIHRFLRKHALHWIEAMSWLAKISEAIEDLALLEARTEGEKCRNLHILAHDLGRFLMFARLGVEKAPLQTYVAATFFTPSGSIVRQLFGKMSVIKCVKRSPKTPVQWRAALLALEGHSGKVTAVHFSADSSKLASSSVDGTVRIWNTKTGALQQRFEGHLGGVKVMQFSRDSSKLVSVSHHGTVKKWNVITGALLETFESNPGRTSTVQISADSERVATVSDDGTLEIWEVTTRPPLRTFVSRSGNSAIVQFSPDSVKLASASLDGTITVWSASTEAQPRLLASRSGQVTAIQFSLDNCKLASASSDRIVRVWNVETGAVLQRLRGHSGPVTAIRFSPDSSKLAFTSGDDTVKVFSTTTGTSLQTLVGHSGSVNDVQFSPDGTKLASASDDGTVRVWDVITGAPLRTLEGHSGRVTAVQFSPETNMLASSSDDMTVRVWNVIPGAPLQTLEGHSGPVTAVQFSPDKSNLESASSDGKVMRWNATSGVLLETLKVTSDLFTTLQFSLDGSKLALASYDGRVRLWDATTGVLLQRFEGHSDFVVATQFSPDGSMFASASRAGTLAVWNTVTGALLQTLEGHSHQINAIQFCSENSKLASASRDGTVLVWNVATWTLLQRLKTYWGEVKAIHFSSDNSMLASETMKPSDRKGRVTVKHYSPSTGRVRVWEVETGAAILELECHSGDAIAVKFSPSGNLASALEDCKIGTWETKTGAPLQTLKGHSGQITALQYSQDSTRLISAATDKTIRLWDLSTGTSLRRLEGIQELSTLVTFSPDSSKLVSISREKKARVWDATTGVVLQTLEGHSGWLTAVQFSLDSSNLISASSDKTIRVWHPKTGSTVASDDAKIDISGRESSTDECPVQANVSSLTLMAGPNETSGENTWKSHLQISGEWILRHGCKTIWLPPEYRPFEKNAVATYEAIMAFGHASGTISLWEISR